MRRPCHSDNVAVAPDPRFLFIGAPGWAATPLLLSNNSAILVYIVRIGQACLWRIDTVGVKRIGSAKRAATKYASTDDLAPPLYRLPLLPQIHFMRPGETIYGLCLERFNVPVGKCMSAIAQANPRLPISQLRALEAIQLPDLPSASVMARK